MSTTSDSQTPEDPAGRRQPTTQEIPVVSSSSATATQLPPHPGATAPRPVSFAAEPANAPQPTGPVDFVPGPPPASAPPPPPVPPIPVHEAAPTDAAPEPAVTPDGAPSSARSWPDTLEDQLLAAENRTPKKRRTRGRLDRTALAGLVLAVLSVVLLELGLVPRYGGQSYWSAVTLWSAFATLSALLGLLAFAAFYPAGNRLRSGPAWRVAAAGLVGLAVFWVLVVLPDADTDRGFLLTAALGCLGGALWIGPRPKDGAAKG